MRNFGFITVTGQERGTAWARARRSCAIWEEVAREAGIPILQRGLWMMTRRPEGAAVLEAFVRTEMGEGCEIMDRAAASTRCAEVVHPGVQAILRSTVDLRVESREAIPKIAVWLAERLGVVFLRDALVHAVEPPHVSTSRGRIEAAAVIICPGDDIVSLFPERIENYQVSRCKLQMLRLESPGFLLPGALMSDLGLVRYAGYAELPEAAPLRARLEAEQGEYLKHGIHLIVVQSADGSLVMGDSHHYARTTDFFANDRVDELILEEFTAATGLQPPRIRERWIGTYASATNRTMFVDSPSPEIRIVMVTTGSGASTGFAIGEEVIDDLFGRSAR